MANGQLEYWKHGTGRFLWWLLVTAPLWGIGAFILIRDAILPLRFRDIYLLQFMPSARVYWYWYVVSALVYVIVVMFFVAPAANRATLRKLKERHRASFRRYRERQTALQLPLIQFSGVAAEPNISPQSTEIVWAGRDEQGFIIEAGESEATIRALVVPYKNERHHPSLRRVGDIDGVRVEISYVCYDGPYSNLSPGPAVWLSEKRDKLPFGRYDAPHRLVIALIDPMDESRLFGVHRQNTTLGKAVREVLLRVICGGCVSHFRRTDPKAIKRSDLMFERDGQLIWGPESAGPLLLGMNTWRSGRITQFQIEGHGFWKQALDGIDEATFADNYADWQNIVAGFIRRHYTDKEVPRFLFEGRGFTLPTSFRDRISRQIETLKQLENKKGN